MPYDRGNLFALLVDYRLRRASGGATDYDDLLAIMRARWNAAPAQEKPDLRATFLAAARQLGLDIDPLVDLHIERGEPIPLPPDLFQPCGTVETVERPAFDPGFDRSASSKAGVFVGVDPDGPAHAAGVRDGMRRIAYVSSAEGNSQVPMVYRVGDQGGEREISWLPEGKTRVAVRQFTLGPDADGQPCRRALAGN
jgi:predicted metalloprotease with PDZ domain